MERNASMSLIDWVGMALLVPFLILVLTLIGYLIVGSIGSGKRRRQVQIERAAARAAAEARRPGAPLTGTEAADD
jgi:hypothetical protein